MDPRYVALPAKAGIQGKRRALPSWVPAFAGTAGLDGADSAHAKPSLIALSGQESSNYLVAIAVIEHRRQGDDFRIAMKRIDLINCDAPMERRSHQQNPCFWS
jgi:hypothetical protein